MFEAVILSSSSVFKAVTLSNSSVFKAVMLSSSSVPAILSRAVRTENVFVLRIARATSS